MESNPGLLHTNLLPKTPAPMHRQSYQDGTQFGICGKRAASFRVSDLQNSSNDQAVPMTEITSSQKHESSPCVKAEEHVRSLLFQQDNQYSKIFLPTGLTPSNPLAGAQDFSINDKDSIISSDKVLQDLTTRQNLNSTLSQCGLSTRCQSTAGSPGEGLFSTSSTVYYPLNTTSPQMQEALSCSNDMKSSSLQNGEVPCPSFFPQFENHDKKRDSKHAAKAAAKGPRSRCDGCRLNFNKLNSVNFCHNCQKVYDAVSNFVLKAGGTCKFIPESVTFELQCSQNHTWTTDFKTKQVKKWCKLCKTSERIKRKELNQQMDQEKLSQYEQLQQQLFREAKQDNAVVTDYESDSENQQPNFLMSTLQSDNGEYDLYDQGMLSYAVTYVISTPEHHLVDLFERLKENRRQTVYRRLARMLHPDKNPHLLAKEAFQKLYWAIRRNQIKQRVRCGLLFEGEEKSFYCQPQRFVY